MPLRFEIEETGEEVTLYLAGKLSREVFDDFLDVLVSVKCQDRHLVLDVGWVTSVDNCGLGVLLSARDTTGATGVLIRGASDELRQILGLVNLGQPFEIE